ncbi:MAG TPA: proline dehydrogenase family protein [Chloroflexota bacterium]|nr:proline dehydrogenase family protein [Chloroflexota bacterium]
MAINQSQISNLSSVKSMKNPNRFPLILFAVLLISGLLLYSFGERWLRSVLLYLSTAVWAQYLVSHTGLAWRVASRFIAGETVDDAITAARAVNSRGLLATLNYLGEHVHTPQEAGYARDEIVRLLDCIHQSGVEANVSVKPSQLGLNVDPNLLYENLHIVLDRARQTNNRVRIDMEESSTVDTTLGIYRRLRDEDGYGRHVGVVIQAYLYRSEQDIAALAAEGAWVRLCKGAYAEPPEVAFPQKADTDANFVHLAQIMLSPAAQQQGMYPCFATHDEKMVQAILEFAQRQQIPKDAFEFQMLYGIRRELQEQLAAQGYRVRVYIPYGTAWYPYFVRRLAERPANLWFFIGNLLRT